MVRVWRQLRLFAGEFLTEQQLGLTVDGRVYLDWLLLRGAQVIVREGLAGDDDALYRARSNIELLLATAGGMSATAEGPEAFFAGLPRSGRRGRIGALDIRRALRHLPPLWPLTTRKRDAPSG